MVIDLHMAGAIHRLQRIDALFLGTVLVHLDDEHVLAVGLPVARFLPKNTVHHLRCPDFLVARRPQTPTHVILKLAVDRPAVWVPEDHAGRFFLDVEQLHLAAQLAVVAFGGLFQHGEVGLEVVAVAKGDTVDALQHRAAGIAQPVGPCHMGQFEGIGRHLPGMLEMRAPAEVLPRPMPVHPQVLTFGDAVDQLQLEGFVAAPVVFDGPFARPDLGLHWLARIDDMLHPGFDSAQVFRGKGLRPVKVIKPAVVAYRANGDLHVGPDLLHGAGHDVGKVMSDQLERRDFVLKRVKAYLRIRMDRPCKVPVLSVHHRRNRRPGKRGTNGGRHLGRCHPFGIAALIAVRKCQ